MKASVREEARRRLRSLSTEERARASHEISRRVWELPEVAGARRLLLYAALPEEVATDEIAREAARRGIELVYPRCLPAGELELHRVEEPDELRVGRYAIREPDAACPTVGLAEIDAALIPGLGWDRARRRMGRGAGYYDRLLGRPEWRAFTCGLFFAAQEFPSVPVEAWDAALDAVVTERATFRTPAAGGAA